MASPTTPLGETTLELSRLRKEVDAYMKFVTLAIAAGDPVDPEHLVVIRGSSEQFASTVESHVRSTK